VLHNSEHISVLKQYNIARHYNLKNQRKVKKKVSTLRREKVVDLKRELQSQQNVIREQSSAQQISCCTAIVSQHSLHKTIFCIADNLLCCSRITT
jgi:hypothetical protein